MYVLTGRFIINNHYKLLISRIIYLLILFSCLAHANSFRNIFQYQQMLGTANKPQAPLTLEPIEITRFIPIHYANIATLIKILANKTLGFLSPTGSIVTDSSDRGFWVHDTQAHIHKIGQAINQLDKPAKEILIKTRIVDIDNTALNSLGVLFHSKNTQNTPNSFSIPIIGFRNNSALQMQLVALAQHGKARIISKPQIITLNTKSALIESGQEIPYQEKTGDGNTSVAFKKAVLRLKVTPTLMPHHKILLQLSINQDDVSSLTVNGVPGIRTQKLQTQVLVNNKDTFVLGGIFVQRNAKQREGIPVLQNLPLLGALFRHHQQKNEQKELLIFITPQVINNT